MKIKYLCLCLAVLVGEILCIPVFQGMPHYLTISESFPVGTILLNFTVTGSTPIQSVEGDSHDTSMLVRLETTATGDGLTVNVNVITVNIFDRDGHGSEGYPGYGLVKLTFRASDVSENDVRTTLTVYITDINDNAPQLINIPYIWTIPEKPYPGPEMQYTNISAIDIDNGNNGIGGIRFQLQSGTADTDYNGTFEIDAINGTVSLKKQLHYEEMNLYRLLVIVQDQQGAPGALNASAEFIILVEAVSDNPHVFVTETQGIFITENAPLGHTVTKLHVMDGDIGIAYRMEYRIADNNCGERLLTIGLTDGVLRTAMPLDADSGIIRENRGVCTLNITASKLLPGDDQHYGPSFVSADVYMFVADVNDNVPVFSSNSYHGTIYRFSSKGSVIMMTQQIYIQDNDQAENAQISLELQWSNGSDCSTFRLSTYTVYLSGNVYVLVEDNCFIEVMTSTLLLKIVATEPDNPMHRAETSVHISSMYNLQSECPADVPGGSSGVVFQQTLLTNGVWFLLLVLLK